MIRDMTSHLGAHRVYRAGTNSSERVTVDPSGVRGIVLAGVHAWGGCAFEQLVARPLLPVAARPLIWHILLWIRRGGVVETTVCGNSDTSILRRSLGNGSALDLSLGYCEDVMPRGPAGCARDAALEIDAETFLVVDGTVLPCIDLAALLAAHAEGKAAVTMVVSPAESTGGRSGEAQEPIGIYLFSRAALEEVPSKGYQDIKETLIPDLYGAGKRVVTHVVASDSCRRVTDAASYLSVNTWALEMMAAHSEAPEGYSLVNGAWLHSSALVHPAARLVGPVLVGAASEVEAGAMIVGPSTIGSQCTIGRQVLVSRSAIWDRCCIGRGAIVDHSILTDDVHVDATVMARQTLAVSPQRSCRTLLNRLASYCRLMPSGARGIEDDPAVAGAARLARSG
ncbi:MAG: sugar phosphate nucleotidyltransferase [Planctomycetota bacterium]